MSFRLQRVRRQLVDRSRDLTFWPSWRKYTRTVRFRYLPLALVYLAVQLWLAGQSGAKDSPWDLLPISVLVLAIAGDVVYRVSTVVRITPEHLEIRTLPILRKVVPRSAIRGVALRGVLSYTGARRYAVIFGEGNRNIATLPEGIWDEDDLRRLQSLLGPTDHSIRYVSSAELSKEFPGTQIIAPYGGWLIAIIVVALIFISAALERR